MPNHFHLMIQVRRAKNEPKRRSTLNNALAILLRSYTRALQTQEGFSGSLFQQKTKAKILNDSADYGLNHPAICVHYIHQNPLKAKLVTQLQDWEFSSFKDYAGLRNGTLCNKAIGLSVAGIREDDFARESRDVMIDIQHMST